MHFDLVDGLLLILVVVVSLWVGRRSSPVARAVLVGSALAISALLFLPTWVLRRIAGRERVESLQAAAQTMSLTLPDIVHFVAFAALAALLWTLRPDLRGWRGVAVLLVLAVAAELTQVLTSRREPRLSDVAINLVGAAVGVLLARMFVRPARSG